MSRQEQWIASTLAAFVSVIFTYLEDKEEEEGRKKENQHRLFKLKWMLFIVQKSFLDTSTMILGTAVIVICGSLQETREFFYLISNISLLLYIERTHKMDLWYGPEMQWNRNFFWFKVLVTLLINVLFRDQNFIYFK